MADNLNDNNKRGSSSGDDNDHVESSEANTNKRTKLLVSTSSTSTSTTTTNKCTRTQRFIEDQQLLASQSIPTHTTPYTMYTPKIVCDSSRLKILITGGAGFVGSHLVDKLMQVGHEIIVLGTFERYDCLPVLFLYYLSHLVLRLSLSSFPSHSYIFICR